MHAQMTQDQPQELAVEAADEQARVARPAEDDALVEDDMLIEDISIDGMCGVY